MTNPMGPSSPDQQPDQWAPPGAPTAPPSPVGPATPPPPTPAGPGAPQAPTSWSAPDQPGWTTPPRPDAVGGGPAPRAPQPAPGIPDPRGYAPQPGIIPLRPLGLGELFEGTFRAVRSNPTVLFGFSVAVMAVVAVISGVGMFLSSDALLIGGLDDPQASIDDELTAVSSQIAGLLTTSLLSSAGSFFATLLLSGVLSIAVADAVLGLKPTLAEAWSRFTPRFLPLIGATILVSLIGTIAVLVVGAVLVGVGFLIASQIIGLSDGGGGIVLVILMVIVFVVLAVAPSLYLQIRFLYTPITVVLEEAGPVEALKRSWALTRGAFWRTAGRLLLIIALTGAASGILSTGTGVITGVAAVALPPTVFLPLSMSLTFLLTSVIMPITTAYQVLMYLDQRFLSENLAPALAAAAQARP
ncbi:glycerophosphoryl diester phosphodiesterase membrane domain-containing protein [Actinomyces sp. B33]|uniref:DUF975 family protein n=1 Tax=Actinomyces sp. B33 TaxID=2942131 RepID=UPI00233FCF46|nr:DUF975 family protein [Actinomyces sp. B33]MDC4232672.1 glycerophosphoryl diester phosphodiesterase membrane domain-containing protein [Actinomyces sp. B33]